MGPNGNLANGKAPTFSGVKVKLPIFLSNWHSRLRSFEEYHSGCGVVGMKLQDG